LFLGILFQSALIPTYLILTKGIVTEYLAYVFAGFGTIIMVKSTKQISLSRLLGIYSGSDQVDELVVSGLYSKIRHPFYAGFVLIFIGYFLFTGTAAAVVHLICLAFYIRIGSYLKKRIWLIYTVSLTLNIRKKSRHSSHGPKKILTNFESTDGD
jgi:protein-S-isoprenylcysteine O-methyltransferase Ste14